MQKQRETSTIKAKWKQADLETLNACSTKKNREIMKLGPSQILKQLAVSLFLSIFHLVN